MSPPRLAALPPLSRRMAVLAPLALAGCSSWFGEAKKPLPGKRIDVLPPHQGLAVSPNDTARVVVPEPMRNASWPVPGGNAAHAMGSLALGADLHEVWRASIGQGAAYRRMLTASPVVSGGTVFTMDAAGIVTAIRFADGRRLWRRNPKAPKDRSQNVGGGLSIAGDLLYAATGRAELVAIEAKTGAIRWRQPIDEPARAAPAIGDGKLFLPTMNGELLALSADKGERLWSHRSEIAPVGVLGEPTPALAGDLVIAGFSSGELSAFDATSGVVQWSDNLGATFGAESPANLSAVRALPVVNNGVAYAVSLGGLLVAEDIHSGRRVFFREVASGETPALAGDWLFLLSTSQHLAAIGRTDGLVRWITEMPSFKNPKHERGPILWHGPLLAGGRLLLAGDNGELASVEPTSGAILERRRLPGPAALAPVVADATLLLLLRDGTLTAWR